LLQENVSQAKEKLSLGRERFFSTKAETFLYQEMVPLVKATTFLHLATVF
jgi:hypothetical protein